MALKMRKDIKKSSYYVWFLGAKESKGLRGKDFILPVIDHLVQREKDIEPFKVTLQISHKGLKIIQTVLSTNPKTAKPKNETIKHFIPHNTITCVYQDEDMVSCILLLFNPVTKCPLHVHVYRCDSIETATLLKGQLEILIERPENQKKFLELEARTKQVKEKKKFDSSLGSDTGTSTRESESSEERYPNGESKITTLYDSLAAELRQKLGKNESPILLPPRDYDTVHRQKGNLQGIDLRRCLNTNIVGSNAKGGRKIESSGGSSGIGSDHAPSPDSPESPERFNMMDNQSTSDEEWNAEPNDSTLYLMHGASDMILPRASRHADPVKFSPEPPKSPDFRPESREARFDRYPEAEPQKYQDKSTKEAINNKYQDPSKRYDRYDSGLEKDIPYVENPKYHARYHEEPQKYPTKYDSEPRRAENGSKRNSRYHDFENEEFREGRTKEETLRPRSKYITEETRYYQEPDRTSRKYEELHTHDRSRYYDSEPRDKQRSKFQEEQKYFEYPDDKTRQDFYEQKPKYIPEERFYQDSKTLDKNCKLKYNPDDPRYYSDSRHSGKSNRSKFSEEDPRSKYTQDELSRAKYIQEEISRSKYQQEGSKYVPEDVSRSKYLPDEAHRSRQEEISRTKYTQDEVTRAKYLQEEISRSKYSQEGSKYLPDEATRSKYISEEIPRPKYTQEEIARAKYLQEEVSRSKYPQEGSKYLSEASRNKYQPEGSKYIPDDVSKSKYAQEEIHRPKFPQDERSKYIQEDIQRSKYPQDELRSKYHQEDLSHAKYADDFFDDVSDPRRRPEDRQRSPTPPESNVSPRDRFKDAKEKFLLLEKDRQEEEERLRRELQNPVPILPNMKDKTFLKRHESMVHPKDRYVDDRRYEQDSRYQPQPAPRTIMEEEVRFRREVPLDRYRSPDRYEKNRRSLFTQIEEEHKKNSNEIAKELKRRSYMENTFEKDYYHDKTYHDAPEGKRYPPGVDREGYAFSKSNAELDKVGEKYPKNQKLKQPAGYRHSYAEPKLSLEKMAKKHYPDLVHRTNSSVSNSGRVGIASVNPY